MKKYSLHQKPNDGEERKLNKPVICYPNHTLKVKYWENYKLFRHKKRYREYQLPFEDKGK